MGRVSEYAGVGGDSLIKLFKRWAGLVEGIVTRLDEEYQSAPVKQVDETSWRTHRRNSYVLLFATR